MDEIKKTINALEALRTPAVIDELELQNMVEAALLQNNIEYKREARCGKGCRVDFLLSAGVAVEVKARRRPYKTLMAQLKRYAACETVTAIIFVTNDTAHLPSSINEKPLIYLNLKRLWGVAI